MGSQIFGTIFVCAFFVGLGVLWLKLCMGFEPIHINWETYKLALDAGGEVSLKAHLKVMVWMPPFLMFYIVLKTLYTQITKGTT